MKIKFSIRNLMSTNTKFTAISVMQIPTQMHSCVLFPEKYITIIIIN